MGESHMWALILDFRDEWEDSSSAEFPLKISLTEVEEIEKDGENADKAIAPMNDIRGRLGN